MFVGVKMKTIKIKDTRKHYCYNFTKLPWEIM